MPIQSFLYIYLNRRGREKRFGCRDATNNTARYILFNEVVTRKDVCGGTRALSFRLPELVSITMRPVC